MRDKKLIQFYLTNMCNSRCKTCHIWKNNVIEELHINDVLEICSSNVDTDFVLGGGEFTLYKYRNQLLKVLDSIGANYTVLTNAVNYNGLKNLLNRFNIKNLTMSCDGKNHDKIRGVPGNLWNIAEILHNYSGKIPNIKLSYTYSSLNEDTFEEDMDFIKNTLLVDKVYFCIAQDMDLLKTGSDSVVPKNLERILNKSYMLYDKDLKYIESLVNGEKKNCDSTDSVFTIYSNGDVVRCQSIMSKDVLGNIREKSFNEIIKLADRCFECPYDKKCNLLCQRRYD